MDKFDLIRSFSKVHNRPLNLLEQEQDPRVTKASEVVANAAWQENQSGMRTASLPKADGGSVDASLYRTGSINIGGRNASWDENSRTLLPGKNEKQFKAILTMLAGGAEGEPPTEGTSKKQKKPGEGVADWARDQGFITDRDAKEVARGQRMPAGALVAYLFNKLGFGPEFQARVHGAMQRMHDAFHVTDANGQRVYDTSKGGLWARIRNLVGTNVEHPSNYLYGATAQSLEQKLARDSYKLEVDGEGNTKQTDVPPDPEERSQIAERLADLAQMAATGDPEMCEKLQSFAVGLPKPPEGSKDLTGKQKMINGLRRDSRNRVLLVSPSGDDIYERERGNVRGSKSLKPGANAVAIPDKKGVYSALLIEAQKKCNPGDQNYPAISLPIDNTGGENANRGFAMEEVPALASLAKMISAGVGDTKCFQKKLKEGGRRVVDKIDKLNAYNEKWSKRYDEDQEQLSDPETAGFIADIQEKSEILGGVKGDSISIVKGMIGVSRGMTERGSVMALPAGKITGHGRRQDVLEIYEDCDKANEALAKPGQQTGGVPVEMNIEDLKTGDSYTDGILDCMTKPGADGKPMLDPSKPICVVDTSLKNYMNLNKGVTAGSMTVLSTAETNSLMRDREKLQAEKDKVIKDLERLEKTSAGEKELAKARNKVKDIEAIEKARDNYQRMTGMSDGEFERAQKFLAVMDARSAAINGLPPRADVITGDDAATVIPGYNPLETLDKITRNTICKDLDMQGTDACKEIMKMGETLSEDDSKAQDKYKAKIAALANMEMLHGEMLKGNKDAKNALKMLMLNTGGDSTDTLALDVRTLEDGKTFAFKHNQPLQDFMDNPNDWNLERIPGSTKMRAMSPNGGYIELEASVDRDGKTSYILHYSKKLIKDYNSRVGIGQGMETQNSSIEYNNSTRIVESILKLGELAMCLGKKIAVRKV